MSPTQLCVALDHYTNERRRAPAPLTADERIDELWSGRIPRGKLVMLHGPPGNGKSTMMLDIAARVSTGSPMPLADDRRHPDPAAVVVMSAEDGLADTIRPRLDKAGADVNLIFALTSIIGDDGTERPPSIPGDLDELEGLVKRKRAALVIVDVLDAYLGGGVDSHRSHDVRLALSPLAAMAERTRAAVVCLGHLRKSGAGRSMYRALGSVGITGAARVAFTLARDPDDDAARILAPTKSNLAIEAPALRFRLVSAGRVARVEWIGVAEGVSADDLDRDPHGDAGAASATDEASEWLRGRLADGEVAGRDVIRDARREGYSERVLRDARERLGVLTVRRGQGRHHHSVWTLPDSPDHSTHDVHACTSRVAEAGDESCPNHTGLFEKSTQSTHDVSTHDLPPTSLVETACSGCGFEGAMLSAGGLCSRCFLAARRPAPRGAA